MKSGDKNLARSAPEQTLHRPAPRTSIEPTSGAVPALLVGCLMVGASSTLIKLSGTSAGTAAFLRCALALLVLVPVAVAEHRRHPRSSGAARMALLAAAAGALLAADYLMWTQSILDAGAAVATVLIGVQVVVFPVLAWIVSGERISSRFFVALPVMVGGLVLTGGVLDTDPQAAHPVRGAFLGTAAGVCFAGYLLLVRRAGRTDQRMVTPPVAWATASAAIVIGMVGAVTHDIHFGISAAAWVWLIAVAVCGQALSFVLINYGSVRMAADRTAAIMLLQPVAAIVLGVAALHERPALSQYMGMVITIGAIALATTGNGRGLLRCRAGRSAVKM